MSKYDEVKLRAELSRDEGRIPHAYYDSLGYWTIGVGHLIDKRKGGYLREHIIDLILDDDIADAVAHLDQHLPWWRTLSDARQRVLINMTFNLGIGTATPPRKGLLAFQNTLAAIKTGDWDRAASGMLNSLWARQVGKRAERLAKMMRDG